MSSTVTFRELTIEELPSMGDIDRSELIDGQYTAMNGQLTFIEKRIDVAGWYPTDIPDHVKAIEGFIANGGAAFGAFDGERLVGIVGLNPEPVGGDATVMQLEPLHVSAPYRHQGIGWRLTRLLAERAWSRGARAIYISSIPTRNSVDAYMRMGAVPLATPDPHLFAKEPEDIHLILALDGEEPISPDR